MPGETTYSKYIWDYFMERFNNPYGVAGLIGNLYAESRLNPKNLQQSYETSLGFTDNSYTEAVDSGTYTKEQFVNDSAGYGLAQWTYWSRKQSLYEYWKAGGYSSIGSIELACDFLLRELERSFNSVLVTLVTATSIREASDKVLHDFESPENQSEAVEILREQYGQAYFDLYVGTVPDEPEVDNQPIIDSAIAWAVGIAGDDSHGYDQDDRWSPDYDCSSLLIEAYEQAGCPVKTNGASYTGNMESVFVETGFESIPYTADLELLPGDVLLRDGHTAMYIGDGFIVSAHINENGEVTGGETGDQTGHEIDVSVLTSTNWEVVLRLPVSGSVPEPEPEPVKRKGMSLLLMAIATRR